MLVASALASESFHDIFHVTRHPLRAIFAPASVAVIGATEKIGSVGRTILWNLISSPFGGTVFPINPKRPSILGIRAYPSLAAIGEPVELAVIVTPAPTVPGVMAECIAAGVKGAIIISAGFKEVGPAGVELERQVLEQARRGNMRIIGPNCLGVMNPIGGLNATFADGMARPGNVGFISQSGALLTGVLDWSRRENVGFSAFISLGSMLDVGWGDLIYYLGDDPNTQSIVIYMETIGDARAFLSAAREVALTKPIIVIKPGRSAQAAKAAASHTGSLAGSDEVLAAAFRRAGVMRVNSIADLFSMADVLSKQPLPKGPRLTMLTNAGGPGVLATDALIMGGGELTELSDPTMAALNKLLPPPWSHGNPIDILGDASPERYAESLAVAAQDPNSDGLLVILTPQAMTDPTETAEQLKRYGRIEGKPVLASWVGGAEIEPGANILRAANIPTFLYPDTAVQMFNYMWRYSANLRSLYETPVLPADIETAMNRTEARQILETVRSEGRLILTEYESKRLLAAYGIPIVETRIASSEDEAVQAADAIGYPIVVKLYSHTITHKTDVGGVKLNLPDAPSVRQAYRDIQQAVQAKVGAEHFNGVTVQAMINWPGYELILGSSIDPQFGPVLLFGMGGTLVEVIKDRALGLPPLNSTLARRMMERTLIYRALQGVRGRQPVDMAALEQIMVKFSQLVVEQRWIKEIDINPLLVSAERMIALDARVVLHDLHVTEDQLPRLAIRPYPRQYVQPWTAKAGTPLLIRPIRPEDEPLLVKFHETLSEQSVFMRYAQAVQLSDRIAHERLVRISFNDYDRELALVAVRQDGPPEIVGVGRLSKEHTGNAAQFNIVVTDKFQGQGLGTELLRRLVQIGRDENLSRIMADILPDNQAIQSIAAKLGFHLQPETERGLIRVELTL